MDWRRPRRTRTRNPCRRINSACHDWIERQVGRRKTIFIICRIEPEWAGRVAASFIDEPVVVPLDACTEVNREAVIGPDAVRDGPRCEDGAHLIDEAAVTIFCRRPMRTVERGRRTWRRRGHKRAAGRIQKRTTVRRVHPRLTSSVVAARIRAA